MYIAQDVHANADALSRCPGREENFPDDCPFRYNNGLINVEEHVENLSKIDMFAIDFRECQVWNNDSIARFQQKDEHLSVLLDWVQRGSRPPFKKIRTVFPNLVPSAHLLGVCANLVGAKKIFKIGGQ